MNYYMLTGIYTVATQTPIHELGCDEGSASVQEQAARQSVVLPYEHQGAGQAYQTGDFKDYLPKAAGGQGKGTGEGALGHILYVRDSGSEHDSDEDPDDDLDI